MTDREAAREIKRLRRENEYYKRRLSGRGAVRKSTFAVRKFSAGSEAAKDRSYVEYLKNRIGASAVVSLYSRIFFVIRKYLLASAVFKVLVFLIGLVQSSAALLLVCSALAVLLPAFTVFSLISALIALISRRSVTKKLLSGINGRVYIVFGVVRGRYRKELLGGGALLCVSASLAACGFSSAKRLPDGAYNIHISYIFSLMKKLSLKKDIEIIKIF